jgi:hypothetical protein
MTEQTATLRPAEFSRRLLRALEAADGRRKRRKRDQTPDRIGLELRRTLLEQAVAEDPASDEFEHWLLGQVLAAEASGPVRAMCLQILDEYRFALADPDFSRWLECGAPSADAEPGAPKSDIEVGLRADPLSDQVADR